MLAAGAAESHQRIARDVMTALHRDFFDRIRHVADRNPDEARGSLFGADRLAARFGNPLRQVRELPRDRPVDQGLISLRAENRRKIFGLHPSEQHIAIGDGHWAAAPVTGRPRVGAGAVGTDWVALSVDLQDRAAACRHRLYAHLRRAIALAGYLRLEH